MRWKVIRHRLREPFLWLAIRALVLFVVRLRYRTLRRCAAGCARLLACIPDVRRTVKTNLRVAFPDWSDETVDRVFREVCNHICLTAFEAIWFAHNPQGLQKRMTYVTPVAERLIQEAREGVPLLMITPHLGNWEASAQYVVSQGVPLCAVVRRVESRAPEHLANDLRRRNGMEVIPGKGAVRGMIAALRTGKSIGVLMDQGTKPKNGGVFAPFFGLPVTTSRAPAALMRKLGVGAACFVCVRQDNGLLMDAKTLPKPVDEYASDAELTADLLSLNEAFIRDYPEQYMWYYKRWRYIPPSLDGELEKRYPYYARSLSPGEIRESG
ncbi:MAG: hypothetical protein K9N51_06330 [Candidatus Pacebacteria bacterium]|nr:hypothetical protein [Candidatus Paceibacterota bacterium]